MTRAQDRQVGLDDDRGVFAALVGDHELLHVELVLDLLSQLGLGEAGKGLLVRARGDQAGEGLADLEPGSLTGRSAELDHLENRRHAAFEFFVDHRFVRNGQIAQMNGFGFARVRAERQVQAIGAEGGNGRKQVSDHIQGGVERVIRRSLVGFVLALPKTGAIAADIPIGQLVDDEIPQKARGAHGVVVIEGGAVVADQGVGAREKPSVHGRAIVSGGGIRAGFPAVDIRVEREEVVGGPEGSEDSPREIAHGAGIEGFR